MPPEVETFSTTGSRSLLIFHIWDRIHLGQNFCFEGECEYYFDFKLIINLFSYSLLLITILEGNTMSKFGRNFFYFNFHFTLIPNILRLCFYKVIHLHYLKTEQTIILNMRCKQQPNLKIFLSRSKESGNSDQ